jgi:hypothetical protein
LLLMMIMMLLIMLASVLHPAHGVGPPSETWGGPARKYQWRYLSRLVSSLR